MILIASTRVQIPLILDNYKRVDEDQFLSGNMFENIYSIAFLFETNLIWKYNASSVLSINPNLHEFL